jgi:4-diphosphocytidyl-2-C-methyl-D-erythritol kinase
MTQPGNETATYRSRAKINLYLDVLDRRPDGFTNIETIFQSIDLWDELRFSPAPDGTRFTCNLSALANPAGNLAVRAAERIRRHTGERRGVAIHLEKRIPVAAGLAGGSGNAAATLIALNECWDLALPPETLADLAAELGSDVPYCLTGGTVAATGRGELMEPLPPLPPQWLVLAHPPLEITAGHAYGHPRLTRNLTPPENGKTPQFRAALDALGQGDVAGLVFNRMETGVFHDHPELAALKDALLDAGCAASAMSGSGPTVFGLCDSEAAARRAAARITACATSVVETAGCGVERVA